MPEKTNETTSGIFTDIEPIVLWETHLNSCAIIQFNFTSIALFTIHVSPKQLYREQGLKTQRPPVRQPMATAGRKNT